jgi:Jacalin-like lectin domain.
MKENAKNKSLEIDTDDYISNITGKYNNGLVSLRFQTFKGTIKEFGNTHNEGEEYDITINSGEKTSTIFGSFLENSGIIFGIKRMTILEENIKVLSSLGLLIIKHDKIDEDLSDIGLKN